MLSSWIFYSKDLDVLEYAYIVTLAAFAIGGSATLSISSVIRIFYPLLLYIPAMLVTILFNNTSEYLMLSSLCLLSLIYVLEASRVTSKDYRKAIYSSKIADERAQMLEKLSITDPLTKLNNRLYFNKRFSEEWKRCERLQVPLSIMMLDLDHFKVINDTYGHVVGDACLKQVAQTLRNELPRETDIIARYGGEEFVFLLSNTELKDAQNIAERLIKSISEITIKINEKKIHVSCSIGVSSIVPSQEIDNESLLVAADNAMYEAKARGRNQWVSAHTEA